MSKWKQLFQKAGGMQVLKQYWHGGVLPYALMQILVQGSSKKSLEIVRLSVQNRMLKKLRKKYRSFLAQYLEKEPVAPGKVSDTVWVCWLQGMDNAPELVQRCYRSLCQALPHKKIVVLTEENIGSYVTFPSYILQKKEKGIITNTHFSDILRLELLTRYGGTWVDATVFCTGGEIPSYMLEDELFLFQNLKPGLDGHATAISSWFMTAASNEPITKLTLALLYEYWKKKNVLIDYFLLHDMFQLAAEAYPQQWSRVVPFSNSLPHILLLRLFEPYDEEIWEAVKKMTPFHKLSYKFPAEQAKVEGTYYRRLF